MSDQVKYTLDESQIPKSWYNIVADLPTPPHPVLHPGTKQPVGPSDLEPLFPMELILQEVSSERRIDIPEPVRDVFRMWRPSPLIRARRLEQLPAGAQAIVILQATDPADRRAFRSAADVALTWTASADELLAAVRALALPAGEGYAWCAGEAAAMAALRRELVEVKGHPREAIRAAAYWKRGATGHHENLE